jgi:hypothetical protein
VIFLINPTDYSGISTGILIPRSWKGRENKKTSRCVFFCNMTVFISVSWKIKHKEIRIFDYIPIKAQINEKEIWT